MREILFLPYTEPPCTQTNLPRKIFTPVVNLTQGPCLVFILFFVPCRAVLSLSLSLSSSPSHHDVNLRSAYWGAKKRHDKPRQFMWIFAREQFNLRDPAARIQNQHQIVAEAHKVTNLYMRWVRIFALYQKQFSAVKSTRVKLRMVPEERYL